MSGVGTGQAQGWIWCEHCQRNIQINAVVGHLAQDLTKVYVAKSGRKVNDVVYDQVVDIFAGMDDEKITRAMSDISFLEQLADDYDKNRTDVLITYPPLSAWVERSKTGESFVHLEGNRWHIGRSTESAAILDFELKVNERIRLLTKINSEDAVVVGSGVSTCTLVSNHLHVPQSWLGMDVILKEYFFPGNFVRVKPVKCGNSVHLTIPHEWGDVLVRADLAELMGR